VSPDLVLATIDSSLKITESLFLSEDSRVKGVELDLVRQRRGSGSIIRAG
jgi:hypothetical protein